MATDETVTTGLAMQLAGMDPVIWRAAMDRDNYLSAPKTLPGNRQRRWTTNDIVALRFYQFLTETMKMHAAMAGGLTKQLEIGLLKDPDCEEQGVYVNEHKGGAAEFFIRPEPRKGARLVMHLPVGEWRREIRAELRKAWREKQAQAKRT